jgi:hypothetical protein
MNVLEDEAHVFLPPPVSADGGEAADFDLSPSDRSLLGNFDSGENIEKRRLPGS